MNKYTVFITAYDPDKKLVEMTNECVERIERCSKKYDYTVKLLDEGGGCEPWLNKAMLSVKDGYIVFMNNDIMIDDDNWLEKMTVPGAIVSFHESYMPTMDFKEIDASCFCMSKEVSEKVGLWDEKFKDGYGFSDDDYFFRAHLLGIPLIAKDVKLTHLSGRSWKIYMVDTKNQKMEKNATIFREKWKEYLKF